MTDSPTRPQMVTVEHLRKTYATAVAVDDAAGPGTGQAGRTRDQDGMAPALRAVSDYTPLTAASRAMPDAMLGAFPTAMSLLVLVGWTVVCGLAAVRSFRCE